MVAFYNGRGTAEQWIKEGKHAMKWTRLSCQSMKANAVRLQLHSLAEVALPRELFVRILEMIDDRRPRPPGRC